MNALRVSCIGLAIAAMAVTSVKADTAVTWGRDDYGQVGNSTTVATTATPPGVTTPTTVTNLTSGVTAVGGGQYFALAVQNGAVYTWGRNDKGQLGIATTTTYSSTPVSVSGLSSNVTAVAGGLNFALALQGGAVYAWGAGTAGQLGANSTVNTSTPVAVTNLTSNVTAIAAGNAHSLAIQNGHAYAWGDNYYGELGNGSAASSSPYYVSTPVQVTGLGEDSNHPVTAVAAGNGFSLAVVNGAVFAWGANTSGQLGSGATSTQNNNPTAIAALSSGVTAIAAGSNNAFAIKDGDVYAWGSQASGKLGNGANSGNLLTVTDVLHLTSGSITQIATTTVSSFALSSDGSLWVAGANSYGQLGLGDTTERDNWTQVFAPTGYKFTSIAAAASGYDVVTTMVAVPEPTALCLLGLGGTFALRRRRKA